MIDAGLAARRGVQIDDDVQAGIAAPRDQPVEQRPARAVEPVIAAAMPGSIKSRQLSGTRTVLKPAALRKSMSSLVT